MKKIIHSLVRHLEWVHVPTPVSIQVNARRQPFQESLTYNGLAYTHWAVNKYECFHAFTIFFRACLITDSKDIPSKSIPLSATAISLWL